MTPFRRLFRLPDRASRVEADVDAEIAFHFEMRVRELEARGAPPERARAEALREFGDVAKWRDTMSRVDRERIGARRRAEWWDALWQDLRYAARGLRRQPGFAAVVVLTLALGIGANATMFGIVDRLLLRPPAHVQGADRLTRLYFARTLPGTGEFTSNYTSYLDYEVLRDSVPSAAAVAPFFTVETTLGRGAEARMVRASAVTGDFFAALGVRPFAGRLFTAAEGHDPGDRVAVIGYGFWQRHFGGDPAALGRVVQVGAASYEVVGVAPQGFTGLELGPVDVWLPLAARAREIAGDDWTTNIRMQVVARLSSGAPPERLAAEATELQRRASAARLGAAIAAPDAPSARVLAGPLAAARGPEELRGKDPAVATWLAGVAAVVLLIACANVANLLLARAARRRREIAVRLALGAGRGRLAAQLLVEGLMLATLGGAGGLLLARWGGDAVRAALLPDVAWSDAPLDLRMLAFTAAAALATGVLVALAPMLQATHPELVGALKAGALMNQGRTGRGRRISLRTALLVAQAALSVVLLVGAGLFVRSLRNVASIDLGFDARRVLVVTVNFTGGGGFTAAQVEELFGRAEERVRALPGVAQAGVASATPFGSGGATRLRAEGWDSLPPLGEAGLPKITAVSAGYFEAMGTRVVRGRGFTPEDRAGAPLAAVVNQTMARRLWPGQDPVGKCLHVGADTAPCSRVVGVVGDIRRDRLGDAEPLQYYVPLAQRQWLPWPRALFVRPAAPEPSAALVAEVRNAVHALAPGLPYVNVRPLQELVEPQVRPWRLGAAMFGAFGGLALLIAAVGLYSVISYGVAQRTRELGVRVALGARAADVLRLVVGEGVRVAAAGVALGALGALAAGRFVAPLLFDTSPRDPLVFGGVTLALLLVALVASLVPARRASRVDPMVALRSE